jgi:hypothetical protein
MAMCGGMLSAAHNILSKLTKLVLKIAKKNGSACWLSLIYWKLSLSLQSLLFSLMTFPYHSREL